jgi:hypothetical protein
MSELFNRYGYQQVDPEAEQEVEERNLLLDILGGTAATAGVGAGVTAERARRRQKKEGGTYADNFKGAATDLKNDIGAAASVVTGRTPFDADEKDQGSNRRSMMSYADSSNDPRFSMKTSPSYINNPITQAAIAARDAFNPSSEDFLSVDRSMRRDKGESSEGPRSQVAFSRIPFVDGARDLLPTKLYGFKDEVKQDRLDRGIGLRRDNSAQATGSMIGRAAADFVNNGVRSAWWLINAPQAVSDLLSEDATARVNREGLYGLDYALESEAKRRGWIDSEGNPMNSHVSKTNFRPDKPDVDPFMKAKFEDRLKQGQSGPMYSRRRVGNNLSTLLALPSAIAINSGMGLNNPFGGSDGNKAIFASEDDATVTDNVIAEIAAKYILGRSGDLLPWDEFKKVRPDVSKGEYMAYKGYRFNKEADYNPFDDGDLNMFNGVLKRNNDGINGGEWMFLGKSLSDNTTGIPTFSAIAGAALGAALAKHGSLNIEGVTDGIERKKIERDVHAARIDSIDEPFTRGGPVERTKEEQIEFDRAAKRGQKLDSEIERRERVKDFMENNKYAKPIFRNLRKKGVIGMGLAGGTAGLIGGSVIGHELERRRREEKIQERQERGY